MSDCCIPFTCALSINPLVPVYISPVFSWVQLSVIVTFRRLFCPVFYVSWVLCWNKLKTVCVRSCNLLDLQPTMTIVWHDNLYFPKIPFPSCRTLFTADSKVDYGRGEVYLRLCSGPLLSQWLVICICTCNKNVMKCCSCRSSWHIRLSFQICPWKKHKDSRPTHKPTHTESDHIHTEMHTCANAHAVARSSSKNIHSHNLLLTHTEGRMIILAYRLLTFQGDSWNRYHRQPECVRLSCQSQSLSTVVLPKFFIHIS